MLFAHRGLLLAAVSWLAVDAGSLPSKCDIELTLLADPENIVKNYQSLNRDYPNQAQECLTKIASKEVITSIFNALDAEPVLAKQMLALTFDQLDIHDRISSITEFNSIHEKAGNYIRWELQGINEWSKSTAFMANVRHSDVFVVSATELDQMVPDPKVRVNDDWSKDTGILLIIRPAGHSIITTLETYTRIFNEAGQMLQDMANGRTPSSRYLSFTVAVKFEEFNEGFGPAQMDAKKDRIVGALFPIDTFLKQSFFAYLLASTVEEENSILIKGANEGPGTFIIYFLIELKSFYLARPDGSMLGNEDFVRGKFLRAITSPTLIAAAATSDDFAFVRQSFADQKLSCCNEEFNDFLHRVDQHTSTQ